MLPRAMALLSLLLVVVASLLLLPRLLGPAVAAAVAAAAVATVIATGVSYRNKQCRCELCLMRLTKPLLALLVPPFLLQRHRVALQLAMHHG
jgi:hypothetical protein